MLMCVSVIFYKKYVENQSFPDIKPVCLPFVNHFADNIMYMYYVYVFIHNVYDGLGLNTKD